MKSEEVKYLVKDKGYDSYQQRDSCACYSSSIGTAIQDSLPHYITEEGTFGTEVIRSDNPKFKEILVDEAGRLEKSIEKSSWELKGKELREKSIIDSFNSEEVQYLVRANDLGGYLVKDRIGVYGNYASEGIHDKKPILYDEKMIISSEKEIFYEILKEELFGNRRQHGLEESIRLLKNRLDDSKLNYKIVFDVLATGDSPKLKELDEKRKELLKQIYNMSKD